MLQQAVDLRAEGDELHALLETLDESDWGRPTPFKAWTVNDVMRHLHEGDWLAVLSLADPEVHSVALTTEEEGVGLLVGADLGGKRLIFGVPRLQFVDTLFHRR